MNGWEMLYEAFRFYPTRPENVIARDFMQRVEYVIRVMHPGIIVYREFTW
jgi:hypothetical protein